MCKKIAVGWVLSCLHKHCTPQSYGYKTDKIVSSERIFQTGYIKDEVVNEYCGHQILRYTDMLNRKDIPK